MHEYIRDRFFEIVTIRQMDEPGKVCYAAMHQDYSSGFVCKEELRLSDERYQQIVIDRCLKHGDWGVIEHPQLVINAGYFPHSVMQQIRTHRHISCDVQSFRYTGDHIYKLGHDIIMDVLPLDIIDTRIEQTFYLRPVGFYSDRQGKKYEYSQEWRDEHKARLTQAILTYYHDLDRGMCEEHARGLIPFDVRQHFIMSCNLRSLMHILDLRYKRDAQLEVQTFCHLLMDRFRDWCHVFANWYKENRATKGRLAP